MALEADGYLYLDFLGRRIAKRESGDLEWTILVPGFAVTGGVAGDYESIDIAYHGEQPPWGPH
jgi:hypothetical protein